ncbi:P-loop containing nucleoside triphosphate hydrolase protein [Lasiosphaeria miniovina]|uniref:ATP-dependent RNA helicase n=1 Tax=Lasiosphaeria miniovina TaxID=1954250 RepID=A0AA40AUM0_9PEZI|nr:P-loop containing nucleoside triphosphate hydrolase protein [Lasiosphaeria miniovina]KAK0722234.1 P-loop containing nucleoside triphosphate hydrolase protein [Lasiosphaeria miniovina]
MKTSVLRQVAVCRVAALGARRVHIASKTTTSAYAITQAPRVLGATFRPLNHLNHLQRTYSTEATADAVADAASPDLVKRFADLSRLNVNPALVDAITKGMQYENMTDVQSMTISPALTGRDIVAQAKTGTGKTLAFLVPVIQRILAKEPDLAYRGRSRARSDDIRAIIVSPTRELAEQIGEEARKLTRGLGLIVQTAVGGTMKNAMLHKTRREGCHIMIATPGRLNDLLSDSSSGIDAPQLQALVLDEADRMLDVGFDAELQEILTFLPNRRDVPRQTLLFSATIPKNVVGLARKYIDGNNFEFVQTTRSDETPTHEKVPQYIVPCRSISTVLPSLLELVQRGTKEGLTNPDKTPFKAMVFLPTTSAVVAAASIFRRIAYQYKDMPKVLDIHSKLTQGTRTVASETFRRADSAILFTSDVTARGMDFPNVTHVIQCHLPPNREQYIHRLGRTGRAGKAGEGWLLVADLELSAARNRLPGLPIQRSTDLECATCDVVQPDQPSQFDDIKKAAQRLPAEVLSDMYIGYLGNATKGIDRQGVVDEINEMALHGWGMDQTPLVRSKMVQQMGRVTGLRIGEPSRSDFGMRGGNFQGGRGGGYGSGYGGGQGAGHSRGFGGSRDRSGFGAIESRSEWSPRAKPSF